ncbi:MAG: hypothetical protein WC538_15220 [Thermoanaerobaculia bacterium]|jgi:hypothetical protein
MPTLTTAPPTARARSAAEATFTPAELAAILREASRRQESRDVASLDQALETARELGIDEQHVLAAAAAHRAKKERRDALHALTVRERLKLGRLAWSAALAVSIVTIAASWNVGQIVLIGVSIGVVAQAFRWIRAEIRERTDA